MIFLHKIQIEQSKAGWLSPNKKQEEKQADYPQARKD